ncbi:MAG: hypothetical protein NZM09_08920 [Ignavibacterium sp.]|nr:hypothetical protein [Ignavibacterium sp.]MCX7611787.1 hypothetical protein [Ignavibacterium sp.]MDW8375805.1 hypothetical protein [Ignavibacteriales bacterium]
METKFILLSIFVFILNIPFGFWRANTSAKSIQWFLAIHIPIALIIALRLILGLDITTISILMNIVGFILGQFTGKSLYQVSIKKNN